MRASPTPMSKTAKCETSLHADRHAVSAPSQHALCYAAERTIAEVNLLFLELVNDGLTREELAINIGGRPSLWQRFETWLDRLPARGMREGHPATQVLQRAGTVLNKRRRTTREKRG
jgi:hypothetical protein